MEALGIDGAGNLRVRVLEQVRTEIVSGRTRPGAVLTVPNLSAELHVSTTPVREALLELSRAGLLEPLRNKGFRVVSLTLDALNNLFTLRELLERHAIETLARQGLRDRDRLVFLADEVRHAVRKGDVPVYLSADRAFHEELVNQVGNPLQTTLMLQLRDSMRLYGIESPEGRKRQKASVEEHYELVELADRHEVEKVGALLSHHILSWKPLFEKALEKTT